MFKYIAYNASLHILRHLKDVDGVHVEIHQWVAQQDRHSHESFHFTRIIVYQAPKQKMQNLLK